MRSSNSIFAVEMWSPLDPPWSNIFEDFWFEPVWSTILNWWPRKRGIFSSINNIFDKNFCHLLIKDHLGGYICFRFIFTFSYKTDFSSKNLQPLKMRTICCVWGVFNCGLSDPSSVYPSRHSRLMLTHPFSVPQSRANHSIWIFLPQQNPFGSTDLKKQDEAMLHYSESFKFSV